MSGLGCVCVSVFGPVCGVGRGTVAVRLRFGAVRCGGGGAERAEREGSSGCFAGCVAGWLLDLPLSFFCLLSYTGLGLSNRFRERIVYLF